MPANQIPLSSFVSGLFSDTASAEQHVDSPRETLDLAFSTGRPVRYSSIKNDVERPLGESLVLHYEVVDDHSHWQDSSRCELRVFRKDPLANYSIEGSLPGGFRRFRGSLSANDAWSPESSREKGSRLIPLDSKGLGYILSVAKIADQSTEL